MNVQIIIVILIGLAVAVLLMRNLYRFFFVIDRKKNMCGGCTGCNMSKNDEEVGKDPYRAYLETSSKA